jgi:hypothetical protein
MSVETAVERGVEKLNNYFEGPHWAQDIELDYLDLGDSQSCVLGQLFEGYENGLHKLGYEGSLEDWKEGFSLGMHVPYASYRDLTDAWVEAIQDIQPKRETVEEGTNEFEVSIGVDVPVTLTDAQVGMLYRIGTDRGLYDPVESMLEEILSDLAERVGNDIDFDDLDI